MQSRSNHYYLLRHAVKYGVPSELKIYNSLHKLNKVDIVSWQ